MGRSDRASTVLSAFSAPVLHVRRDQTRPDRVPYESMQDNLIEPSTMPPLPEPGMYELWVLEQPLLPSVVLVIIALSVLYIMRHSPRFKRVALPIALPALLIAAGIYALGTATVTDREVLRERSRALVQSVADGDRAALRAMLADDARLASVFANASGADRIVTLATTRNPGVVRSAEVGQVNAGLYGQRVASTQIRVRTQGDMLPSLSWWRVDWQRPDETGDDWTVTHIEPIWIQGFSDPGPRD